MRNVILHVSKTKNLVPGSAASVVTGGTGEPVPSVKRERLTVESDM